MIRALLVGLFVLTPAVALADTNTTIPTQSNSLQSSDAASVSPQSSSLLQPASSTNSPLQSADATAGGASQSQDGQALQQTSSSDQSKLLIQAGADAPQALPDAPNLAWLKAILMVLLTTTVLTAIVVLIDRRTVAPSQ